MKNIIILINYLIKNSFKNSNKFYIQNLSIYKILIVS